MYDNMRAFLLFASGKINPVKPHHTPKLSLHASLMTEGCRLDADRVCELNSWSHGPVLWRKSKREAVRSTAFSLAAKTAVFNLCFV
jgi:hypothetical protein